MTDRNIHTIDITGCKLLKKGELEKLIDRLKELEDEKSRWEDMAASIIQTALNIPKANDYY